MNSLGGCEDGGRVGCYGVDRAGVGPDFSQLVTVLNVPQLEEASSTPTEQDVVGRHELQSTHPILVSGVNGLQIQKHDIKSQIHVLLQITVQVKFLARI